MNTRIDVFKGRDIRRTLHHDEWWFSVVDVCGVLTDSVDPGAYWRKLKQRLNNEGSEVVTNCHGLKLQALKMLKALLKIVVQLIRVVGSPGMRERNWKKGRGVRLYWT